MRKIYTIISIIILTCGALFGFIYNLRINDEKNVKIYVQWIPSEGTLAFDETISDQEINNPKNEFYKLKKEEHDSAFVKDGPWNDYSDIERPFARVTISNKSNKNILLTKFWIEARYKNHSKIISRDVPFETDRIIRTKDTYILFTKIPGSDWLELHDQPWISSDNIDVRISKYEITFEK